MEVIAKLMHMRVQHTAHPSTERLRTDLTASPSTLKSAANNPSNRSLSPTGFMSSAGKKVRVKHPRARGATAAVNIEADTKTPRVTHDLTAPANPHVPKRIFASPSRPFVVRRRGGVSSGKSPPNNLKNPNNNRVEIAAGAQTNDTERNKERKNSLILSRDREVHKRENFQAHMRTLLPGAELALLPRRPSTLPRPTDPATRSSAHVNRPLPGEENLSSAAKVQAIKSRHARLSRPHGDEGVGGGDLGSSSSQESEADKHTEPSQSSRPSKPMGWRALQPQQKGAMASSPASREGLIALNDGKSGRRRKYRAFDSHRERLVEALRTSLSEENLSASFMVQKEQFEAFKVKRNREQQVYYIPHANIFQPSLYTYLSLQARFRVLHRRMVDIVPVQLWGPALYRLKFLTELMMPSDDPPPELDPTARERHEKLVAVWDKLQTDVQRRRETEPTLLQMRRARAYVKKLRRSTGVLPPEAPKELNKYRHDGPKYLQTRWHGEHSTSVIPPQGLGQGLG